MAKQWSPFLSFYFYATVRRWEIILNETEFWSSRYDFFVANKTTHNWANGHVHRNICLHCCPNILDAEQDLSTFVRIIRNQTDTLQELCANIRMMKQGNRISDVSPKLFLTCARMMGASTWTKSSNICIHKDNICK